MKKVVIMIALIFFYLSNSISADGKLKDIIKKAKGAVVCVLNYNSSGKAQGLGTGFFINDKGYIVTNVHVVKDAEKVVVKTLDGTMYNLSKVVNSNEDDDLFIFTVDGIISAANYLDLNTKKLDVGDEVMAIGNPLGLEQTVSTGIISGIRELKEFGYLYQITAPVSPGSSGGPVVDYDGNVIGVAFLQAKIGQNLNFAMPSYKIAKLMENSAFIDFQLWKKRGYSILPDTAFGLVNLGFRYYNSRKYQDAIHCAKIVIEKDPNYTKGYMLAGLSLYEVGRHDDSIKYMKYALRLEPNIENGHNALGEIYYKMKFYNNAAQEYYIEIKMHPDNVIPYNNLAKLYGDTKMFNDEKKIIDIGLQKASNPGMLHERMGIIYGRKGDFTNAMEEYITAVHMSPGYPDTYYDIGIVYLHKSDKTGAMRVYEILKKLDPDMAEKLLKKINL